jgi:Glycosyltransferase 61
MSKLVYDWYAPLSAAINSWRRANRSVVLIGIIAVFVFECSFHWRCIHQYADVAQDSKVCEEFSSVPLQLTTDFPVQLSDFIIGSIGGGGNDGGNANAIRVPVDDKYAVCDYFDDKISQHFAHAMQQVYSCWSFWQAHPDKLPVLNVQRVTPSSLIEAIRYRIYKHRNENNPFMVGIYQALTETLGVKVVYNHKYPYSVKVKRNRQWLNGYSFIPNSTASLRNAILGSFGERVRSCPVKPRIAIFDRKSSRSFDNVQSLQSALQHQWQDMVDIVYLEGKSFAEQIGLFSRYDIVVSPHGAQLTSIPFMPDCGGVLEVFPDGYLIPQFYGSLAHLSMHSHAYLHLSHDTRSYTEIQEDEMQDREYRRAKRSAGLCPSTDSVVEGVHMLYDGWQQCCSIR